MRLATRTLSVLAILFAGTMFAVAQERPGNVTTASHLTTATDEPVITFVHRPAYRHDRGWYGYYHYPPYRVHGPHYYYWYGPPRYHEYPVVPYRSYYPYGPGFGFEFHGPRRSFSFGF
ncbi:MAG TPA: hypothetical protein VJL29_13675 [Thermoguttaceae bacterium]|nr:hypothetical protein [Thermoguttaceae bacterium]